MRWFPLATAAVALLAGLPLRGRNLVLASGSLRKGMGACARPTFRLAESNSSHESVATLSSFAAHL